MRQPRKSLPWRTAAIVVVLTAAVMSAAFMLASVKLAATERAPSHESISGPAYTLTDGASSEAFPLRSGRWYCYVSDRNGGAWGGAAVTLQWLPAGGTDFESDDMPTDLVAMSANAGSVLESHEATYRWQVTGGSSTSLYAKCGRIGG